MLSSVYASLKKTSKAYKAIKKPAEVPDGSNATINTFMGA